jgi:oligopeptide/dipeptide ABC transporter ATP-binding protein
VSSSQERSPLLDVEDLRTYFRTEEGLLKAVDGVSFQVHRGETLGVVGESGCGKSVTSLSVMQLIRRPRGNIEGGRIVYHPAAKPPIEITALDPNGKEMRALRGREISMIFQEPMTSLNPVYPVGYQIIETLRRHERLTKQELLERAVSMLELVRIPDAGQRIGEYPHQLSGGMRQRVMIAMALACRPNLVIADEPTTALDVTIEAQILHLMRDLQEQLGMSIMIITHDLGVIGEMARRVVVMYMGKVVEEAPTRELFGDPQHPYTQGLLKSIPRIGLEQRLAPIRGSVPSLRDLPPGCKFAPRCPHAMAICHEREPAVFIVGKTRRSRCWLHAEGRSPSGEQEDSRARKGGSAER